MVSPEKLWLAKQGGVLKYEAIRGVRLWACRASYKAAVKGDAYVASALDSHWERVGPALQSTIEGDLVSSKGGFVSKSDLQYRPCSPQTLSSADDHGMTMICIIGCHGTRLHAS